MMVDQGRISPPDIGTHIHRPCEAKAAAMRPTAASRNPVTNPPFRGRCPTSSERRDWDCRLLGRLQREWGPMKAASKIVMGAGLTIAIVACGETSTDLSTAEERSDTDGAMTSDQPVDTSTTTAATPTSSAGIETTTASTEPAPQQTFYKPPVVTAGGTVAAEIRSTTDPTGDPSIVEFRLVEFEDGPFVETTVVHLAAGADASLWSLYIDDRLRSKFSYPTGTHGSRITPEQYVNGVTVILHGTDAAGEVVVATEPVEVPPS